MCVQWLLMLIRSNTLEDHIHITLIHLRYLRNLPAAVLKIDARKRDVVRMDEVAVCGLWILGAAVQATHGCDDLA